MRKTVFFLLLSWSITTLNAQIKEVPSSVSLEEAVEWGMIHNRTMQTANLELQKAQKQKWETLSIGFPQITANLNYQNNIEQPVSLIPAQSFLVAKQVNFQRLLLEQSKPPWARLKCGNYFLMGHT